MVQLRQVLLLEGFGKGREGSGGKPRMENWFKEWKNTSSIVAATATAQCCLESFPVTCEQ